ncbi:hypothetical protein ACEPAF_6314 [Sanghuangporus sanghuang]
MISRDSSIYCQSIFSPFSEKPSDNRVPRVEPLLPEHLDKAFESIEAALKDDPLAQYLQAGKDRSPVEQTIYKRIWKLQHKRLLKRKAAYTVNGGDAVIIATPPDADFGKPSPVDRTIDYIVSFIRNGLLWINRQQEQVKRYRELESKKRKIIENNLGDRVKSMVYIDLFATNPESQGQGYGTALLNTVLFSADIRGRAVFLTIGNTSNIPFYESFGFVHVTHFFLGEENPKWDKPPLVVPLMVREIKHDV